MKLSRFNINNLASIVFLTMLAACSSKLNTYANNADATPQIATAEATLLEAEKNQVNIFAPASYEKALDALKEARSERKDNASNVDILKAIETTNKLTAEANRKSEIAQTALQGVAQARMAALQAKANEHAEKDFKKADEELSSYTANLEDGSIKNSAKTAKSLLSQYQSLEVKGILATNLKPSASFIEKSKDEGAEDNAPKSWTKANATYAKAEGIIRKSPHNAQLIDPAVGEAQFEAEKLLRVTRKTKAAGGAKAEDVVLQAETQQQYIHSQSQKLVEVRNERNEVQSQVQGLKGVKDLQDKVAAISRKFDSSEADVYQQGKSVILRLKGIQFPNNKNEIPSASFTTLKKVQESIQSFNSPRVRIEGHTDAVGNRQENLPLSQQRAEAVRKYITANLDVKNMDIKTEGFGSSKPISSNKTSEGRAQNRRIDIVIEEM